MLSTKTDISQGKVWGQIAHRQQLLLSCKNLNSHYFLLCQENIGTFIMLLFLGVVNMKCHISLHRQYSLLLAFNCYFQWRRFWGMTSCPYYYDDTLKQKIIAASGAEPPSLTQRFYVRLLWGQLLLGHIE